jgi:hypothetical protein
MDRREATRRTNSEPPGNARTARRRGSCSRGGAGRGLCQGPNPSSQNGANCPVVGSAQQYQGSVK